MPYDFEEENDRAIRMILTKAWPWHYEREFRLISPFDKILVSPLRIDSGCFVLPPNSLKSVIAGCQKRITAITEIGKAAAAARELRAALAQSPDDEARTKPLADIEATLAAMNTAIKTIMAAFGARGGRAPRDDPD